MRTARRTLPALLLALLLPGCASLFGPSDAPGAAVGPEDAPVLVTPAETPDAPALALDPGPDAAPRLPAAVRVQELWLRPVQDQAATLDAPGATRVEWYVGVEGIHPDVRTVGGRPYVTAEKGKASEHPAATGSLAVGASVAMRLAEPGRHLFSLADAPGAALVATVTPAAEEGETATVFLVKDETGPRFLPDRVAMRPGARLVFVNQADAPLQASRDAFQAWIGAGSARLDFTPVDEGLYVVVAEVADEAGARGEAYARFLVDFDRPSTRRDFDYEGRFLGLLAPPGEDEQDERGFEAEYPVVALRVLVNATSFAPQEGAVRVRVERAGTLLGEAVSTRDGGLLVLADLPEGPYAVRILPEGGALVDYDVHVRLQYRLPVPERLREGAD